MQEEIEEMGIEAAMADEEALGLDPNNCVKEDELRSAMTPEIKAFEYGDLSMTCSCGGDFELGRGVKNGVSLVLPTNDTAQWVVSCDKCKTTIKVFFKESSEETIAIQRKLEEELKNKKNEQVQQGNTEEDIHTGVSGDSELSTESNA